jgi:hypothetical protein
MTLAELRTNLYRRLNYPDSPDTSVTTRLTMFLNQRHRRLLSSPALRQLREGVASFASVTGQTEYALGYGTARMLVVRDPANNRTLEMRPWSWYRSLEPDPANTTGTPEAWIPLGQRAVARKPDGTGVWVASGAAGDTTQTVTIHAVLANAEAVGATTSVSALLTGTTRVRLGTTQVYDDVVQWSVTAACAGALTLYDAAVSGNTLGTLPIGRTTSKLTAFALYQTPASALTYEVDIEHELVDMANTWDEPLLPVDFHDLLIMAATADEYEHRDDSRYSNAIRQYDERFRELKAWLANHRAALASPLGVREIAPLGPWYPRQGW